MERAIETYRGVVNTWECDEMGHMNVRFYVARAMEGIAALALELGLTPHALRAQRAWLCPREQHLRFHRELHPGQPIAIRGGIVDVSGDQIDAYQELWRTDEATLCATLRTRFVVARLDDDRACPLSEDMRERASALRVEVAPHGAARGVGLDPPRDPPSHAQGLELGLFRIYRGLASRADCDGGGKLAAESFMGRISDGVPHFFQTLSGARRDPKAGIGGAALEYRLIYHAFPRDGDVLEIRSGLKAQESKATHFCHFMFDLATGACVMSSAGVAVLFDMKERKAMAPPPEQLARLQASVIPGLGI